MGSAVADVDVNQDLRRQTLKIGPQRQQVSRARDPSHHLSFEESSPRHGCLTGLGGHVFDAHTVSAERCRHVPHDAYPVVTEDAEAQFLQSAGTGGSSSPG